MADHAVVIYGRGGKLGDFKQFVDDMVAADLVSFKNAKTLEIQKTESRAAFFDYLNRWDTTKKIKQLHIFSHSIGGGLFLGYEDPVIDAERVTLINGLMGRNAGYLEVVKTERGAVLTDDLVRAPYAGYGAALRTKFASDGFIKIWGCNAGVKNWRYSDPVDTTFLHWTADPRRRALCYYWRALNEQNMPKPSISQAFADYFQVKVKGALSGATIEVKRNGKWISSDVYKKQVGRYPGPSQVLRLQPSKGTYDDFAPAP